VAMPPKTALSTRVVNFFTVHNLPRRCRILRYVD
jgi:hypothetical protein